MMNRRQPHGSSRRPRPLPRLLQVKVAAPRRRIMGLLVVFVGLAVILAGRCLYVQGLDLAGNAAQALMPGTYTIPAARGTITDRNGQVMAESVPAVNITADPTIVATNGLAEESMSKKNKLKAQAAPGIIAGVLQVYLGGDFQTYYDKLTTTTTDAGDVIRYTMLARTVLNSVDLQITDYLGGLGYVGLFREQAPVRNYPNGTTAANVLGFMTYSDDLEKAKKYPWTGGEGLEYALNTGLTGVDGEEVYESSPYGRIPTGTSVVKTASQGVNYELTLDLGLQYMQDQRLAAAVQQSGARSGIAITLSVTTGEILALSDYPTFDPNNISAEPSDNLGNRAVRDAYEPGSVEKVLTMAALVDQGLVAPDTRVIVPGQIASGDSLIKDAWGHDTIHLTAAGVLARSSNVGILLLLRQMDKATITDYLTRFGLGQATNSGLPGEATGYVPGADMSDQTRDNMAFGQGLSVTALQEAAAVAAIVNGGVYVSPSIVASATKADGTPVTLPEPAVRRVVSAETSAQVLRMMESVVDFNKNSFDIPGYRTAGKSGTAEAIDPTCGCYRGYVMSYLGVAPADNPQLLTYVVLDHPTTGGSGTAAAAPAVKDIMSVALPRYGVPTSTTDLPGLPIEW